ncbi:MAG: GNAT family N-acetyltransferase [Caldilineales bacterium]|nr:GNAT family N-acetyltransferase [Caldilineales bacterium]
MPEIPVDLHLEMSDQPCVEKAAVLHEHLKAHNTAVSPAHRQSREPSAVTPFNIFVYDSTGDMVAGLTASTYWDWLDIDDLWVAEALRKQGVGASLLRQAEAEAVTRGCRWAKLKTFHFQARGFYEKLGYRVVGELKDFPPGGSFYWMRKDLEPANDARD